MAIDFTEISFVGSSAKLYNPWGGRSAKVAQIDLQSPKNDRTLMGRSAKVAQFDL